jgi:hypothetical protein
MGMPFAKKNRLFLKKSSVRFFYKQPVFFCGHLPCKKMHIYAVRENAMLLSETPFFTNFTPPELEKCHFF